MFGTGSTKVRFRGHAYSRIHLVNFGYGGNSRIAKSLPATASECYGKYNDKQFRGIPPILWNFNRLLETNKKYAIAFSAKLKQLRECTK